MYHAPAEGANVTDSAAIKKRKTQKSDKTIGFAIVSATLHDVRL